MAEDRPSFGVQQADLRARGPVSAAVADLIDDPKVSKPARILAVASMKGEAIYEAAAPVLADPTRGGVGKMVVDVGRGKPAIVSNVTVIEDGVEFTVTFPGLDDSIVNPVRWHNPPVVHDGSEDPAMAFSEMVRQVVNHFLP